MFFQTLQLLFVFCLSLTMFRYLVFVRKRLLSVATSTSKNRTAENVGKFPIHLWFFRIFAIKWVVGKFKLFIPRALYSLKRKIKSVTNILDYKICEGIFFVLAWVEELRAIKVNLRFFFGTRGSLKTAYC